MYLYNLLFNKPSNKMIPITFCLPDSLQCQILVSPVYNFPDARKSNSQRSLTIAKKQIDLCFWGVCWRPSGLSTSRVPF